MHEYLTVYLKPRVWLWILITFGVVLVARIPFLFIHYVPYHLGFQPWIVPSGQIA